MTVKKKEKANPLVKYENMWVAVSADGKKVVASGKTVKELDDKMEKIGDREAIYTKVLPFDEYFSP